MITKSWRATAARRSLSCAKEYGPAAAAARNASRIMWAISLRRAR